MLRKGGSSVINTGNMPGVALPRSKGVSVVELLIVLSVIAVMLALAAPSLQSVAARADIKAAAEDVSQAVRMAKNTARVTSQPVTVTFSTGTSGNSISFAFADGGDTSSSGLKLPSMDITEKISVATELPAITFDPMGLIVGFTAGTIVLTSTVDSSKAMTVSIVNNLGYVTIAEGAG